MSNSGNSIEHYISMCNKGYDKKYVTDVALNMFSIRGEVLGAFDEYFLLRYDHPKLWDRIDLEVKGALSPAIKVGTTLYSVLFLGVTMEEVATNKYNVEVSFRKAIPEYGIPPVALVRKLEGTTKTWQQSEIENLGRINKRKQK